MKASEKYWTGTKDCGFTYQFHLYECLCEWTKEIKPKCKSSGWNIYEIELSDTSFGLKSVKCRRKEWSIGCNSYFELQVKVGGRYVPAKEFDWEL